MTTAGPFADIDARITAAVFSRLSNVVVSAAGVQFAAILDAADTLSFDTVMHGTHLLQYAAGPELAEGDTLEIGGEAFIVSRPPRIASGGLEAIADLVRA